MPANRPNVLFLLSDEHSFRCFSHLDANAEGEPVHTPTFDALANNGTVFDQTYCQMPLCTPSRMCLLTGRYVRGCGAWSNSSLMRPDVPTMPGAFADAGYATCLVGKMHFGGARQYNGFQHRPYGDMTGRAGHQTDPLDQPGRGMAMRSRTADAGVSDIPDSQHQEQCTTRESIAWLREHTAAHPDQPWFLCASFSRPHFPLTAPKRHFERYWPDGVTQPKVGRTGDALEHPMTRGAMDGFQVDQIDETEKQRARAAYFACVDYLDEVIGDMLASLERDGLLDNTIIVYTSDHGEMAGEHGLWWKHTWHEASARVPWFIQTPEQRHGDAPAARLNTPASLADLFPTLAGLCEVPTPNDLDGVDLSQNVRRGIEPTERGPVCCDNLVPRWGDGSEFRMVRDGPYKYIAFRDAPELLFNVEDDPFEQHNLAASNNPPDALARLRQFVTQTMDFEAAAREYEVDRQRFETERLDLPQHTNNLYHMRDGRLWDGQRTLYDPHVVVESPADTFTDWPGDS